MLKVDVIELDFSVRKWFKRDKLQMLYNTMWGGSGGSEVCKKI